MFRSILSLLTLFSLVFASDCSTLYPEGFPTQNVDKVLCKKNFVIGYSFDTKTPLWAVEHLSKKSDTKRIKLEGFRYHRDYALERKHRATSSDYAYSTQDRSPLVPFEDMNSEHFASHETFVMSNIAPQDYKLNRHAWVYLERGVRELADVYNKVIVVTGVAFLEEKNMKLERIGRHQIAVPTHYYKAVYAPDTVDGPKMWAWIVPNKPIDYKKMKAYRTTVDKLENRLGIDFFPNLTKELQERVESKTVPL